ncbi:MAG: hypothetical protein P9L92_05035 [Candidatus Electryonea clarkiae]|nr:hypothetical protein [Candidatus Electryonea clarkiae]MDP8287196.1 hypothetical protein [Candidatus Electryonea clarkiae]
MNNLTKEFERYLKETLGIAIETEKWKRATKLPFYLRDRYIFYRTDLLNQPLLVMVARKETEQTPALIRKHLMALSEIWEGEAIYLDQQATAYNRKRMIEHRIPFVIPGNQMYLPMFAIDLREYFRTIRKIIPQFSPSTQTVVLHALLSHDDVPYTPKKLADQLGYTSMTFTRAFNELETSKVGEVTMKGRERVLHFPGNRNELWEKAKLYMRNPVKKRVWIMPQHEDWLRIKAGLNALAHYSLLNEPVRKTFAVSMDEWKFQKQRDAIMEVPSNEQEAYELEIWSYPPRIFAEEDIVDRFSLFLSLREDSDERVQSALQEMMENVQW